jgi:hypothetical protein
MPNLTAVDRALLQRVAHHLEDAAEVEFNGYHMDWGGTAEAREAKRRYDRLLRDAGYLRALTKRLSKETQDA